MLRSHNCKSKKLQLQKSKLVQFTWTKLTCSLRLIKYNLCEKRQKYSKINV